MCAVTLLHSRTHWGLQGINRPLVQRNTTGICTLQSTELFSNSRKKALDDLYQVSWSQQLDNIYPPLDRGGVLPIGLHMLWFCSLSLMIKRVLVWTWRAPKEIVVLKLPVALIKRCTYTLLHTLSGVGCELTDMEGIDAGLAVGTTVSVWALLRGGRCLVGTGGGTLLQAGRKGRGGGVQVVSQTVLKPYAQFSLHDKLRWQYPAL